jgi:hypothetical protein
MEEMHDTLYMIELIIDGSLLHFLKVASRDKEIR